MLQTEHVTIQGTEYVIGRLDLFKAMNVSRLVAPILPVIFSELVGKLAEVIDASKDDATATVNDKLNEVGFMITTCAPVLQTIAEMPEQDFREVLETCLGAIERKTEAGYARLMQNGKLMFADVDQGTALVLVFRVLARELRPFISALKL